MGPIRLFTPYKRRRRNNESEEKSKVKREGALGDTEIENVNQSSNQSHSKEAWQTFADNLDTNADYHLLEQPSLQTEPASSLPEVSKVIKRLEEISQTLARVAGDLKQCVEDVRVVSARQIERLEHERASDLLQGVRAVEEDHVPLSSVDETETKKCANCNREASAECSLCRRTPYCSTYCQKKDWAAHQIECLRSVPTIHSDTPPHQSIMLIVESQHQ